MLSYAKELVGWVSWPVLAALPVFRALADQAAWCNAAGEALVLSLVVALQP